MQGERPPRRTFTNRMRRMIVDIMLPMRLKKWKRSAIREEIAGQINRGSQFGEIIYWIAKNVEFHTFLEIGTWNGQGSTKCFIEGLLERSDNYHFISLENNKKFYDSAVKYWTGKINNKIQLVYGTVVRPTEMMKDGEVRNHPLFPLVRDHYNLHYQSDITNSSTAPLVLDKIPSEIDVLLLDGGEFSGYAEMRKFKNRGVRVVLLDDINTIKNSAVFEELRGDKRWTLVLENRTDRNGTAIFAESGHAHAQVVDIVAGHGTSQNALFIIEPTSLRSDVAPLSPRVRTIQLSF